MIRIDEHRRGIIAAGTWTEDRIKRVDHWPNEEQVAEIIETSRQGGGSAHNLGVDIRRLDPSVPVTAIGLLGTDAAGDFLWQQADRAGIDTSGFHRTDQSSTSFTDVISDAKTGKRTFFHHRGTSDLLTPAHFDFARFTAGILHLGLLGLHKAMDEPWENEPNGWSAVLKAARSQGIVCNLELVSISPERIREVARPCLPLIDLLVVNEFELAALAGLPVTGSTNEIEVALLATAGEAVLAMGPSIRMLVAHYPGGAVSLVRTEAGGKLQQFVCNSFAIPEVGIKGAAGAGDAFAAGILYGLHEAWSLESTLELAHATAAASLRAADTVSAVGSAAECLSYARQFSVMAIETLTPIAE